MAGPRRRRDDQARKGTEEKSDVSLIIIIAMINCLKQRREQRIMTKYQHKFGMK
jgi:hypothetical protein